MIQVRGTVHTSGCHGPPGFCIIGPSKVCDTGSGMPPIAILEHLMAEKKPTSRTSWIALIALAAVVILIIVAYKRGLGQW